jgi:hypothetical protein
MNANRTKLVYRLLHETSAQAFVWAAVAMVCLLGMCGFVVDMGHAMVINRQLQMSTNAAALAGAEAIPNSDYNTIATNYSSNTSSDKNYSNMDVSGVSTTVSGYCSSTVTSWGVNCVAVGSSNINALTVTQSVTIPTYFIRILGIDSMTLTSQASAAWKGEARYPYNVALVVDSTDSMNDEDGDSSNCGSLSRISCAMTGAQTFLEYLSPCSPALSTCPTVTAAWPSANISGAVDEVALYTFPGLNSSQSAEYDSDCGAQIGNSTGGSTYRTSYYNWPVSAPSAVAAPPTANPATYYQIVGFSSDYKNSDANTTSLLSGSYLVKAVGGGGNTCSYNPSSRGGIQDVGGAGTYYAAIIYQAQYDLYQEYVTRLNAGTPTENVMIVLSDGDATSSSTQMGNSSTQNTNNSTASNNFPAYVNECHQAITAALDATNGTYPSSSQETDSRAVPLTTVYTVAYGAEASGCDTGGSSGTSSEGITPCDTMREMSSSYNWTPSTDQTFYSDYTASGGSSTCISNSNSSTNINEIFKEITANLSHARLIPVGE